MILPLGHLLQVEIDGNHSQLSKQIVSTVIDKKFTSVTGFL